MPGTPSSAAERAELSRHADRVVVGDEVAGPGQHAKLTLGQEVERLLRRRRAGASGPRRPTAAARGGRGAGRPRAARASGCWASAGRTRAQLRARLALPPTSAKAWRNRSRASGLPRAVSAEAEVGPEDGRAPWLSARSSPGTAAAARRDPPRAPRAGGRSDGRCRRVGITTRRDGVRRLVVTARSRISAPMPWPATSGRGPQVSVQKRGDHLGEPVAACRDGAGGPRCRRAAAGRAGRAR